MRPIIDRTSVALFAVTWLAATTFVARAGALSHPAIAIPLGMVLGYLTADALAGLVHWFADRYFAADTPLIGPALIGPFREHHVDPRAMAAHDFFEVCGSSALATLPLNVLLLLLPAPASFVTSVLWVAAATATLALFLTNQLHAWAHAERPPRAARALQRSGLVLDPARHARHHRDAHDHAYCVTSGWLNPLLDRTRTFARLERWLAATGLEPR